MSAGGAAGTLAMVMIAKDEREHVRPCLESFGDHVDEIVLVDGYSRDGTVPEVRRVCREHGWTGKLVLGRFRWRDDFGAKRNYAESLASCEFVCNVDLDETIVGAERLRECCEHLTADIGSMTGANMLYFQTLYYGRWGWWPRLARRGAWPWVFRVADPRPVRGGIGTVGPDICHFIHRRERSERPQDRHVRTAELWLRREPTSAQTHFELAYELLDAQRPCEAVDVLEAFAVSYPDAQCELEALVALSPELHELWSKGVLAVALRRALRRPLAALG